MPTAIPFTALGRGNGFPFCLDPALIAPFLNYDLTDPIELDVLMNFFWNLYDITSMDFTFVKRSYDFTNGEFVEETISLQKTSFSAKGVGVVSAPLPEPFEKVCFDSSRYYIVDLDKDGDPNESPSAELRVTPSLNENGEYCLAYQIQSTGSSIFSPTLGEDFAESESTEPFPGYPNGITFSTVPGGELDLPLNDDGDTTTIEFVGITDDTDVSTTTTPSSASASADFYTYS